MPVRRLAFLPLAAAREMPLAARLAARAARPPRSAGNGRASLPGPGRIGLAAAHGWYKDGNAMALDLRDAGELASLAVKARP